MLHIVHLIQRRHPRHAARIIALLVALSACAAVIGTLLLSARH